MKNLVKIKDESKFAISTMKNMYGNTLKPELAFRKNLGSEIEKERMKKLCLEHEQFNLAEAFEDTPAFTYFEPINKKLSKEIRFYVSWVEKYQVSMKPFHEKIYVSIRKKLFDFFGREIDVSKSGSFITNLLMPWSDINIIVCFKSKIVDEAKTVNDVEVFQEILTKDTNFIKSASFELKKNIVIMKIYLTEKFNNQLIEVIFKLLLNPSMPKNEEIMGDYIKLYPISRPMYLVFRTILHNAGLDDPSAGGINSLALFLMIIGFIQKIESMSNPNTNKPRQVHSQSFSDFTQGTDPSILSLHSYSSKNLENVADVSVVGSVNGNYLAIDRIGEIFLNMVYFYGFSFDYLNNYIHPYVSKGSRYNSFHQVR
jgi:DNA polymerase sigma